MAFNPGHCGACGFTDGLHEHHIVPRTQGGLNLPTVYLCVPCHAAVHIRTWDPDHLKLTIAGLTKARARGVKLGNRTNLAEAQAMGAAATKVVADAFAANVLPVVRDLQAGGLTATRAIAEALNTRGIRTARGGDWHHSTVRNLLARA